MDGLDASQNGGDSSTTVRPLISIVIPCRNEEKHVRRCVSSVLSFEAPTFDTEILLIDGKSTDGTRTILEELARENAKLRVLSNDKQIVPSALNLGIRNAKGDFILRLDMHSEYPGDYVLLCFETMMRTRADVVGGVVVPFIGDEDSQLVAALTSHRFGVGNSAFRTDAREGQADTVPFGFFNHDVFDRYGLFDERLVRNQDYEFNARVRMKGGRVWLNPAIKVFYHNQPRFRGLLSQAYSTGQWNPWTWYVAPYAFSIRHVVPMFFTLAVLLFPFLSFISMIAFLSLLGGGAVYFLAALVASIQQSRRYSWRLAPVLPFAFAVYHFVYGAGILAGIVHLMAGKAPVQHGSKK